MSLSWTMYFFSFLLSLSKVTQLVDEQERRENCHYIMFDEERLGPKGVSNLLHILTVKSRPY